MEKRNLKTEFKSKKHALLFAGIMWLVLMSLGGCHDNSQRKKYFDTMRENDSLKQVINDYVPTIVLPMRVGIISADGYAICTDSNGREVRIDINPDDYKLGDIIK